MFVFCPELPAASPKRAGSLEKLPGKNQFSPIMSFSIPQLFFIFKKISLANPVKIVYNVFIFHAGVV